MNKSIDLPGGWGRLRTCRHGLFLYNVNDLYVGRSLDVYGEYSEEEARLFGAIVRKGDVALDVGANIGTLTIPLARAVGPTGIVFAFEPQRITYQMLCANLALNGFANVVARHAAVGKASGIASIPLLDPTNPTNFGDVSLKQRSSTSEANVPVETIDGVGLTRCRFIKADVQGMEAAVLEGAARTIATCRPVLYVENDQRSRSPGLISLIRSLGYRMWWHLPPLFQPNNYFEFNENVFGNMISVNLLCYPAESDTEPDGREVLDDMDWPTELGGR